MPWFPLSGVSSVDTESTPEVTVDEETETATLSSKWVLSSVDEETLVKSGSYFNNSLVLK